MLMDQLPSSGGEESCREVLAMSRKRNVVSPPSNSSDSAQSAASEWGQPLCRVLVEQGALSALEEEAFVDSTMPIIGLLVGNYAPERSYAVLSTIKRLCRDAPNLLSRRRIVPSDSLMSASRRIREGGQLIVGYYYTESEAATETGATDAAFSVDHEAFLRVLRDQQCLEPVIVRVRSVRASSEGEGIEASIRLDTFRVQHPTCPAAAHAATTASRSRSVLFLALPLQLIDRAYLSPDALEMLLRDTEVVELEEAETQRTYLQRLRLDADLPYDALLTHRIQRAARRTQILSSTLQLRLHWDILQLQSLIGQRLADIEAAWNAERQSREQGQDQCQERGQCQEQDQDQSDHQPHPRDHLHHCKQNQDPNHNRNHNPDHNHNRSPNRNHNHSHNHISQEYRTGTLASQLVAKELPSAYADSMQRLSIANNIPFHEHPTLAASSRCPGEVSKKSKKKTTASPSETTSALHRDVRVHSKKNLPRPILPAAAMASVVDSDHAAGPPVSPPPSEHISDSLLLHPVSAPKADAEGLASPAVPILQHLPGEPPSPSH